MIRTMNRCTVLALGVFLVVSTQLCAAEVKSTTITVKDMHCGGCAKKVSKELMAIPGVAKTETDVEARTVKVTPKPNVSLSPKSLWEAVEKADKTPSKLAGPSGTFTAKPKS